MKPEKFDMLCRVCGCDRVIIEITVDINDDDVNDETEETNVYLVCQGCDLKEHVF